MAEEFVGENKMSSNILNNTRTQCPELQGVFRSKLPLKSILTNHGGQCRCVFLTLAALQDVRLPERNHLISEYTWLVSGGKCNPLSATTLQSSNKHISAGFDAMENELKIIHLRFCMMD